MQIQIDSREKARAIKKILSEFNKQKIGHFVSKLYVGDYMSLDNSRLVIDRKQNLTEIYSNVCHDKKRFHNELKKAKDAGIKLIFLCEHGKNVSCLEDVKDWENPQLEKTPYAWNGIRLYKELSLIISAYGVEFVFCSKNETGSKIIELLGKGEKNAGT